MNSKNQKILYTIVVFLMSIVAVLFFLHIQPQKYLSKDDLMKLKDFNLIVVIWYKPGKVGREEVKMWYEPDEVKKIFRLLQNTEQKEYIYNNEYTLSLLFSEYKTWVTVHGILDN